MKAISKNDLKRKINDLYEDVKRYKNNDIYTKRKNNQDNVTKKIGLMYWKYLFLMESNTMDDDLLCISKSDRTFELFEKNNLKIGNFDNKIFDENNEIDKEFKQLLDIVKQRLYADKCHDRSLSSIKYRSINAFLSCAKSYKDKQSSKKLPDTKEFQLQEFEEIQQNTKFIPFRPWE